MGSHSTCVEHKSTATRHLFLVNPSLSFPRSYPLSGSFEVEHEEDQRRYHGVSTSASRGKSGMALQHQVIVNKGI